MSNSPTPSTRSIAFTIPTHLAEALRETVDDFLTKAAGGTTPAQRAAEIRAQDRDASLDSLAHLIEVAEGSSRQARVIAQFLAGLYNGDDFPFSLSDLRRLDDDLLEHCLQVLRMDSRQATEVHRYFPNGDASWQAMIKRWGLADGPGHTTLIDDDVVHSCQYDTKLDAPGYRDVTLVVKVAVGVDEIRSISLALSAADSERLAADLARFIALRGHEANRWMQTRVSRDPPGSERRMNSRAFGWCGRKVKRYCAPLPAS
ncbi:MULTISPECIES: hypothetical protein [unclassified Caballeronia]|uniref:DUF7673 family protein n=1 Tax=unclassified Caballeronia TaxID=2646786 RepID=UPI001F42FFF6|nr:MULTISPECIES: hypothetical protein [unclassified Caballeronia]MCE4547670.1 hypothetical protein [Caballeronia sp. PC1]MCE4575127.1 hypothetical protein [Caballeronia sp. CLC5]